MSAKLNKTSTHVVPEACGLAIPGNPSDLLKMIQQQHKRNLHKVTKNNDIIGRARKQEIQRELFEGKLMEFEDYIYKLEGRDRLNRHFEHLRMETEDELSTQIEFEERNRKTLDFKEKVRKEVEERKLQEIQDREAKKKAAEERRAAVVERLRKKAEDEERRRQEAAAALLRIEEDKAREIQRSIDRLVADQSDMLYEDDMSRIVEQDYRDSLERRMWQQREKERLIEWEKVQKAKDKEENEKRKARMAALEEKKAKFAELQRLQKEASGATSTDNSKGGNRNSLNGTASNNIASTREEAAKLTKQLRIQNRAKFVTKKIHSGGGVSNIPLTGSKKNNDGIFNDIATVFVEDEVDGGTTNDSSSLIKPHNNNSSASSSTATMLTVNHSNNNIVRNGSNQNNINSNHHRSNQLNNSNRAVGVSTSTVTSAVDVAYQMAYNELLNTITSESTLNKMLRELMAEKRSLRLEQKQRLLANSTSSNGCSNNHSHYNMTTTNQTIVAENCCSSEDLEYAKELRKKLAEITFKENAVQKKLDELLQIKQNLQSQSTIDGSSKKGNDAAAVINHLASQKHPPSSEHTVGKVAAHSTVATTETSFRVCGVSNHSNQQDNDSAELFHKAECLLREAQYLLEWLKEDDKSGKMKLSISTKKGSLSTKRSLNNCKNSINGGEIVSMEDDTSPAGMHRRITVALMEISQLVKTIRSNRSSSGSSVYDSDPLNYIDKLTHIASQMKEEQIKATNRSNNKQSKEKETDGSGDRKAIKGGRPPPHPSHNNNNNTMSSSNSAPMIKTVSSASSTTVNNSKNSNNNTQHQNNDVDKSNCSNSNNNSRLRSSSSDDVNREMVTHTTESAEQRTNSDNNNSSSDSEVDSSDNMEAAAEEEEVMSSLEDLPGWEECLHTSMASAAHHAAFYGCIEVLDFLCKYFDCFIMDKKGRTPLFYAALQNRLDCVASLIALDPQWIDVGDEKGDTPLHAAAISNGIDVLSFLLSCEANPDTANYAGLTPSHLARSRSGLETLYNAGAQLYCIDSKSRMPLWFACSEGRSECVEFLCSVTPHHYILWLDEDAGETCLHRAASQGHAQCVEIVCQSLQGVDDLYTLNKKQHTAAHVAGNAAVLKALYENGANLWITDSKGRTPLFTASFLGRADCVAFLIDIAIGSSNSTSARALSASSSSKQNRPGSSSNSSGNNTNKQKEAALIAAISDIVSSKDRQGDTALHAACLCGHLQCANLLLYYTRTGITNQQGLTAQQLAIRAGHEQIAKLVSHVEKQKDLLELSSLEIFSCDFSMLSAVLLYYGSRWTKVYDLSFDCVYYQDRATGSSQWERPQGYDEPIKDEQRWDKARSILHQFYGKYNPEKLSEMNNILTVYRNKYTELFILLANKYNVQDLSMFEGVDVD